MLKLWGLVPPEGTLELSEFSLLQSVLYGSNDQLGFGRYYYNEHGLFYVDENGNRLQNGKICIQDTPEELPNTCFLLDVVDRDHAFAVDQLNVELLQEL